MQIVETHKSPMKLKCRGN